MDKIKITFEKSKISAVVELYSEKCPKNISNLMQILPITIKAVHGKWGGNEIWFLLDNFKKYEPENETFLPSIGEIMLVPQKYGVCFDLWYDRGWCCGPNGFVQGSAVGKIVENLPEFAREAAKLCTEGSQNVKIERI